jgi:hypothetical protein
VWAPTNDALESLPSEIKSNEVKLKEFIGNHISYQEYYTYNSASPIRVKMLSGKNLTWHNGVLETAEVVTPNRLTRNGVLHITNNTVPPKGNAWDVILSMTGGKQADYLQSLTYELFVDSLATQIGVDPATGEPIYEPGTGMVMRNHFLNEVYDISNEDSLNTFIVLTDEAFDSELAKLTPYFKTVTANEDSTNSLATSHLVKDLVFKGAIQNESLPDTLISLYGVKVPIDKSAIVETHVTSNGIVYIMNKVDFRLKDKFPPIRIEGEHPNGFSRSDKDLNIHYRFREWASNGFDLRVWNHGVSQFNVRYKIAALPAMQYKVYWRTVNDFVDTTVITPTSFLNAFQQKVVLDFRSTYISSPAPIKDFGYAKVLRIKPNPDDNRIKYLGDYTHANYKYLYLYVVANNVASPAELNAIEVDYIELVPVF